MQRQTLARIESWALGIVSRIQGGLKVEDSRVELKREWPPAEKAARQLAAHANSALGEEILWIVGLDETAGVIGADSTELSNWWSKMQSQFDGTTPSLAELSFHVDGKILWALVFDTSRAPFVVNNARFGKDGGGSVSREIPWREGTSVRSATRNDLIRLLTPVSSIPDVEILGGAGHLQQDNTYPVSKDRVHLHFSLQLYLTPLGSNPTVIPFHRCSCRLADARNENELTEFHISIRTPSRYTPAGGFQADSINIERSENEVVIHGPGKCFLDASVTLDSTPEWAIQNDVRLSFRLAPINASIPVLIDAMAVPHKGSGDVICSWALNPA